MRKLLLIGLGGFFGAAFRTFLETNQIFAYQGGFPVNTLLINIAGAFVLALLLTLPMEMLSMDKEMQTALSTGFLGAFTTFSTLCKEAVTLGEGGFMQTMVYYLLASALLGLLAAWAGVELSKTLAQSWSKQREEEETEV